MSFKRINARKIVWIGLIPVIFPIAVVWYVCDKLIAAWWRIWS